MTDNERYEKLENDRKKIEAAQKKLREKMRLAEHKKYYDACMALGLTIPDLERYAEYKKYHDVCEELEIPFSGLKDYPELMAFKTSCTMLSVNVGDADVTTVFQYVIGSKEYQEMMRELKEKSAPADVAPGSAQ